MNRREVIRILNTWKRRLPLDHWTVTIEWDQSSKRGTRATVFIPDDYHDADLVLSSEWTGWSRRTMNQVLLHELCHLMLRDLDTVAAAAADQLGPQGRELSRAAWLHAEEGLVEALALRLTRDWGLV